MALCLGLGCKESTPGAPVPKQATAPSGIEERVSRVRVDGSSTVFPLTDAAAQRFQDTFPGIDIEVGISGTGGGMRRLCTRESDIANASRPIKGVEASLCRQNGVEYVEFPVAFDGIAVLVHPRNTWADTITTAELARIWQPEARGRVDSWNDVRPDWPDRPLRLYGAGGDSGTYDYFTQAIVGEEHRSREDYVFSEDDNLIVEGVANDESALGFFGYAYYAENTDRLKLLPVDDGRDYNGQGPILASPETITNGTYQPLARPLFVYVAARALDRPAVARFVDFLITQTATLAPNVGYVPLPAPAYARAKARVANRVTGSAFGASGSRVGLSVEALLETAPAKP